MIPQLGQSGVLPPFVGHGPEEIAGVSPYLTTMLETAQRFCTTAHRAKLFRGLIAYRAAMRAAGIVDGAQWIDGSFCEDVERHHGRVPDDIDVVSLIVRPAQLADVAAWLVFVAAHPTLFVSQESKRAFLCDAYCIEMQLPAVYVHRQLTYWHGLFTHQRATFLWKGILQVSLAEDDSTAEAHLNALGFLP